MTVPDFTDLAIDLYLPSNTKEMNGPITTHRKRVNFRVNLSDATISEGRELGRWISKP